MSYDFPAHESTRKRRRWGCTCGCVMILIVLIIVGGVLSYFGLKPREQFKRYALMDGDMDGFGVLRINPDDTGAQEFTEFLTRRLEKSEQIQNDGQAQVIALFRRVSKNILSQFLQPEVMIYATYNPATADESVLLSAPLKNPLSWFAVQQFIRGTIVPKPVADEDGGEIYPLHVSENGTSTILSLDSREILISDSRSLVDKGLKYAHEPNRLAAPSDDLQYFIDELALDQPPEGEDLAVAIVNEESRITNMIFVFEDFVGISGISDKVASALATQKLTFADISGMKLTADLASADMVKGELTMYCPNSDTAKRLAKVFESALPTLTGDQADGTFKLDGTVAGRGVTVVVNLKLTGLKAWIEKLLPVAEKPDEGGSEPTAKDNATTTTEN